MTRYERLKPLHLACDRADAALMAEALKRDTSRTEMTFLLNECIVAHSAAVAAAAAPCECGDSTCWDCYRQTLTPEQRKAEDDQEAAIDRAERNARACLDYDPESQQDLALHDELWPDGYGR